MGIDDFLIQLVKYCINTEMKALPAIVWLELSGIYVDRERLNELQKEIDT